MLISQLREISQIYLSMFHVPSHGRVSFSAQAIQLHSTMDQGRAESASSANLSSTIPFLPTARSSTTSRFNYISALHKFPKFTLSTLAISHARLKAVLPHNAMNLHHDYDFSIHRFLSTTTGSRLPPSTETARRQI